LTKAERLFRYKKFCSSTNIRTPEGDELLNIRSASSGSSKPAKPIIALIAGIFCYASVPLFLRFFSRHLDAWTVNSVRYSCGALVWFFFWIKMLKNNPELRSVLYMALIPSLVNICGQICWAMLPYYVEAPLMAFGARTSFVFTVIFSMFLFRDERVLARKFLFWSGVVICLIGFITMYKPQNMMTSKTSFTGMMLTFITAIFWGLYAVIVKRYVIRYPPVLAFGVISLYTALCLDFLAVIFGKLYMLGNMDAVKITLLIGSGIIGIAIAHVLSYTAIAGLGTIVTTGVSLTGPFVTSLGGYILLGEVLSLSQWLGGIMIISGALLLLLARFQSSREIAQIDIE